MNWHRPLTVSFILAALSGATVTETSSQNRLAGVDVSITTEKTQFNSPEPAAVHIVVANNSSQPLNGDDLSVSLHLSQHGNHLERCRRPDCYVAYTPWAETLSPGAKRELDVDLTDLYWNELISSQIDSRKPKNLYSKVPRGSFSLLVVCRFRGTSVTSNVIEVTLDH